MHPIKNKIYSRIEKVHFRERSSGTGELIMQNMLKKKIENDFQMMN